MYRHVFSLCLILLIGSLARTTFAEPPLLISYQGSLTNSGGSPANGTFAITFTIYNDPTAGSALWTETHSTVSVSSGSFSALLGSFQPLNDSVFGGVAHYLGVQVGGDPEMSPRTRLVSVPFSFRVETVEGASGGIINGDLVLTDSTGDSLIVIKTSGIDGGGSVAFKVGTTALDGRALAPTDKVEISSSGIVFYGATTADTTLCLFPNGNIISKGQIAIGEGATAGIASTVFGFGNSADGDSATVTGGYGNSAEGRVSTIGGGAINRAAARATVAGGASNWALGQWSAIGGGQINTTTDSFSVIGGGSGNQAEGLASVIGGGEFDTAFGNWATISGGLRNFTTGNASAIMGGADNKALSSYSTVLGGCSNSSSAAFSYSAGFRAKSNHFGSFVWGDSTNADVASSAVNQFTVRASGGTRIFSNAALSAGVTLSAGGGSWSTISDSAAKENITPVDGVAILEKLSRLPLAEWNYKSQDKSVRHIGPMAQDFYREFGLGEDNLHINTLDPDGVALAAIQQLIIENKQLKSDLQDRDRRLTKLEELMTEILENQDSE
jgi:trimeric autotransporter adhesin